MSSLEAMDPSRSKDSGGSPQSECPRIVGLRHSGIDWACEELPCPPRLQGAMHLRPASRPCCPPNQECIFTESIFCSAISGASGA